MTQFDDEQLEQYRALGLTPMELKIDLELLAELAKQNAELEQELANYRASKV